MGKTIDEYKKDYEAARLAGNAAGMQSANQGANTIRQQQGQAAQYATNDIDKTARAGNSASGVHTNGSWQDTIKDKMNENSNAWHNASAEDKLQLEQANKDYANQLGGNVSFDSGSGTWSGTASGGRPETPVNDYSNYLAEMYAAQKRAALAQLQSAYDKNVAAFNRAEGSIAPAYQAARNQTAGQSEQAKRSFAEFAAASGLNSGAGGQAQLAQNVTLQNNLNEINTSESEKLADLELKRSEAESNYNNAIAQANATGDFELAKSLYQEKTRVDNAWMEQIRYETQQEQAQWEKQHMLDREQTTDNRYKDQLKQQELENAWKAANYGSFSDLEALGVDTTALKNQFAAQASGGGGGGGKPKLTASQALTAYVGGLYTPEIRAAIEPVYGNIFGDSEAQQQTEGSVGAARKTLIGMVSGYGRQGMSPEAIRDNAIRYLDNCNLSPQEKDELADYVLHMTKG